MSGKFVRKSIFLSIAIVISGFISLMAAYNINVLLSKHGSFSFYMSDTVFVLQDNKQRYLFMLIWCVLSLLSITIALTNPLVNYTNGVIQVTPKIRTPAPSGNGEYGTAKWMQKRDYTKCFSRCAITADNPIVKELLCHGYDDLSEDYDEQKDICINGKMLDSGGMLIGYEKGCKQIYYNSEDTHTLIIGATRSGKTRGEVLPSICIQALAGESMINTDPKGELYLYTYPFLKRLGYEVIAIDFNEPCKSARYNFLQTVIDYINAENMPKAIEAARDIVASLVAEDRTEKIWTDGQRAILTCGIISVVFDNRLRPEYQNLTNVYYFLAKMCRPNSEGITPLAAYLHALDDFHPARMTIDISEIAPSKMRGSFYTSALVTLSLFTDPNIYDMTKATEFDIYATGKKKRAIFVILPDEKSTYYPIASLFMYQQYQIMVNDAKATGNRLKQRVHMNCEEIGNFTKIPDLSKQVTVAGGRGIIFNFFLQDFNQLDETYGDKVGKVIRSNAETWIYLQSDNGDTLQELSNKLGKYTIKSIGASSSTGGNVSTSYNLTGRNLLEVSEIKELNRPYQLVTSRNRPGVFYAPDISKTIFNKLLGMGDKKHNIELTIKRQKRRETRNISTRDMLILSVADYMSTVTENTCIPEQHYPQRTKMPGEKIKQAINDIQAYNNEQGEF
ncbi:MAG: type IV secretory system conjugative DNA transfer family protein [Oscillospiraceae bacterium]